ncbi:MAG: glycosyltransferase family 9 protein [Ignavibacteria bacterium]|nr:glycosyltransferase family 9 protein [Ignavibacteria bacterium]
MMKSENRVSFSKANVKNILVVRQHDQLGDMLCVIPLLRALRSHFPNAHITLIASLVNYEVMRNHPYLDDVLSYDKRRFIASFLQLWNFIHTLRTRQYDLAVVPCTVSTSVTSDVLAWLSRAKVRIGAKSLQYRQNPTAFCFTTTVDLRWEPTSRRHQTLRNLDILEPIGLTTEDLMLVIGLTEAEKGFAREFLAPLRKKHRVLVGIHPGAGKVANRWSPGNFASVANRMSKEYDVGIVVTAGPMDDEVLLEMQKGLQCPFELIQDQPIRRVAAMINELDLFVTNDTGVMHIAGALSATVLALFGPTDPLEWAPIGEKNRFIVVADGNINSISVDEVNNLIDVILLNMLRQK